MATRPQCPQLPRPRTGWEAVYGLVWAFVPQHARSALPHSVFRPRLCWAPCIHQASPDLSLSPSFPFTASLVLQFKASEHSFRPQMRCLSPTLPLDRVIIHIISSILKYPPPRGWYLTHQHKLPTGRNGPPTASAWSSVPPNPANGAGAPVWHLAMWEALLLLAH